MAHEANAACISLCDALDRILTKGVVVYGDIAISVAGVDLLYVGLRGLICAIDALGEMPTSLRGPTPEEYAARIANTGTSGAVSHTSEMGSARVELG